MARPYIILAVLVSVLLSGALGAKLGKDYAEGQHARTELLVKAVAEQAQLGAAAAIAANRPINVHTKQVLDREVRIVPDYSRCVHSPDGLRAINAALENRAVASGDSLVPGANTAER